MSHFPDGAAVGGDLGDDEHAAAALGAERLPIAADVLVVPVVEQIGEYGGTWRRGFGGPGDGQNADRIMMDHLLLYDIDGTNIVPNIVRDWTLEADGVTYTFDLRREMK